MPGGGGVRQRPRGGGSGGSARTRRADAASGTGSRGGGRARTSTQQLVRDLTNAATALAKHAEDLEAELAEARQAAQAYTQIQRLINRG
jgi:hypothetical protein